MPADWELHRTEIEALYRRMSLRDVMSHMRTQYNFHASEDEYGRQFKNWNFRKNLKHSDWEYIHQLLGKRKRDGKKCVVYFDGIEIPEKKVKREMSRRFLPTLGQRWISAVTQQRVEGITVCTPTAGQSWVTAASPPSPEGITVCTPTAGQSWITARRVQRELPSAPRLLGKAGSQMRAPRIQKQLPSSPCRIKYLSATSWTIFLGFSSRILLSLEA
ncbi:hypothetical protein K440DRAFT_230544 [Wilcoxina mikolae CBS 423.85]|nr:hypothetical protein K440DRAFT_230544 [Wilcoxina mikolae CBS 423.85]